MGAIRNEWTSDNEAELGRFPLFAATDSQKELL